MAKPEEIGFLWLILIGTAVIFLLTLAIILFVVSYQRKLFLQKINLQELKSAYQNNLLKATIEAQEKERNRIAQDLHDEVGCVLSTLKLYVSQIQTQETNENMTYLVDQSAGILDEAIGKLRSISHELIPTALEKFGLITVLERMAEQVSKAGVLEMRLHYNKEVRLPENSELHLYRIVNELVNNTIKHAQATEIELGLDFEDKDWRLEYKDDGKGLNQDSKGLLAARDGGLGLKTIASRAEMLNAELHVNEASIGVSFEIIGQY